MKLAFVFILVGYGTKAGLAPVHNWLPDAHSEAPSPISALLSGVLLNTAFYGILRFMALVEPSAGREFTGGLLLVFGLLSVGVASVFMLVQDNFKRLLAYSSIEHMGIICTGVGLGGPLALYGSLLHMLNHAAAKPLMFLASGKIQAHYGSTRMEGVRGVLRAYPMLGALTFIGVLALAGSPPFNIFISEFTVLRAGAEAGSWAVVGGLLFFLSFVFYSLLAGFGRMLWGGVEGEGQCAPSRHADAGVSDLLSNAAMVGLAAMVVVLGLRVPGFVDGAIRACIAALGVH
jgi:hydrogenase-4 component F